MTSHITSELYQAYGDLRTAWHHWAVSHDCLMESSLLYPIHTAGLDAITQEQNAIDTFLRNAKTETRGAT